MKPYDIVALKLKQGGMLRTFIKDMMVSLETSKLTKDQEHIKAFIAPLYEASKTHEYFIATLEFIRVLMPVLAHYIGEHSYIYNLPSPNMMKRILERNGLAYDTSINGFKVKL